jgi:large subunit ribosomal protein L4
MKTKVYNQEGAEVGKVDLKPEVFGIEPNEAVVHQYVVNYLARQRKGTASTKVRSDVRGGGRKPYRQKGTGQARMGTIRTPLRRGGGTIFGPHPRSYGAALPKKMRRLAMRSVFSDKAKGERIRVLDKVELEAIKTRAVAGMLANLDLSDKKCLILDEGRNDKLSYSCRNLQGVTYSRAAAANGYDVLNAEFVVLTQAALDKLQEVYG